MIKYEAILVPNNVREGGNAALLLGNEEFFSSFGKTESLT